jgi:glycosyltransferase involved in cell wall biosynthesis
LADVLLVSLGSTAGLREADEQLAASIERAGASVALVRARPPRPVRTFALTDLRWAQAARAAALAGLASAAPRSVLYSTVTAALLWPRPGAIRFDATSRSNRPGRHGVWQRPVERRRLAAASLLLPLSEASLGDLRPTCPVRVLGVPVEPSGPPAAVRDLAAVTYAVDAEKKGLDRVLESWARARRDGEELIVAGLEDLPERPGVRAVGLLARHEYRALLRRSRVYLTAPRREDHGLAQLEALADGCVLVTTPAPGPYQALPIAAALDPRLVTEDLDSAIRTALDAPLAGYAERARAALAPFSSRRLDEIVAREVLPLLIAPA